MSKNTNKSKVTRTIFLTTTFNKLILIAKHVLFAVQKYYLLCQKNLPIGTCSISHVIMNKIILDSPAKFTLHYIHYFDPYLILQLILKAYFKLFFFQHIILSQIILKHTLQTYTNKSMLYKYWLLLNKTLILEYYLKHRNFHNTTHFKQ